MNTNDSEKKSDFVRPPIQSLHTLDADILSSIKDENYASNIVRVLTHDTGDKKDLDQEEQKGNNSDTSKRFPFSFKINIHSTYFYIGLSVFLFGMLGISAYYVVQRSIENTLPKQDDVVVSTSTTQTATSTLPQNISITQKNIFNAEVIVPIQIEKLTKVQIIALLQDTKKNLLANEIKNNINISLSTDLDIPSFFNKIQYSGPDGLIRSLASNKVYNFGLYHKQTGDFETYLVTKIDTFDLAFAGMLEWERFMPVDFQNIYTYTIKASSTETTATTSTSSVFLQNTGKFTDKVIKNIDVRAYTDANKGTQIIYGFINKQYLLITSGEASFVDIVNKLTINNILR